MFRKRVSLLVLIVLMVIPILSSSAVLGQEGTGIDTPVGPTTVQATSIVWQPGVEYARLVLTVSGPDGMSIQREFEAGETAALSVFDEAGSPLPDGQYTYELTVVPALSAETQAALAAASEEADRTQLLEDLRRAGHLPAEPIILSGQFSISGGEFVIAGAVEPASIAAPEVPNDIIHADDVIIQFSLCVGNDCVNGENFGFDTIRLKENNIRIKFEDTSNTASFPTNDWQITANDSANGGQEKFSIDDISNSRTPFTIRAGAPSHSLYVAASGNIGLGTSTPVVETHLVDGDTPTVRLEQDGSSGFTAQTWDVAGNEANFFVRDVSNASRLPFRIRPGAPTSAIDIAASGNVGFGDSSPDASLDIERSDGTALIRVDENSSTVATRWLLELENNGPPQFRFINSATGDEWQTSMLGTGDFTVSLVGTGGPEFLVRKNGRVEMGPGPSTVFNLDPAGNLTINGTLTQSSDVALKENLRPVDVKAALASILELPIYTWNYTGDSPSVRHAGPTAQDFAAAFGLGADDRHIAPSDTGGVALAAIQALYEMVQDRDSQVSELQRQNDELDARIRQLEEQVDAILAAQAED